jgi:hypothetical protein
MRNVIASTGGEDVLLFIKIAIVQRITRNSQEMLM